MGSRACSIDRLDVAHLVTRNSRHCCWPVPKKCSRHKLQKSKGAPRGASEKKNSFETSVKKPSGLLAVNFFFSPQNPNNKMRELGTSGPATIINLVCGLFWCVHYACLGRSTKREREWTSKGVVFRMCHKMSKNAFRTLFSVCQVENLLEFYFS